MERFSQRESVLLGYNLQCPLNNMSSSKTSKPFRNSDVDFHDVFGGPPRRFSMQEVRPGFRVDDDDDVDEPWQGLGNKPVFGGDEASRRRLPSADFFNDIFGGGGASVHSTPKRHGRDYVGSRVSSPLPPKAEPFGASLQLSQFSLPGKVSKGVEVPTFGSSTRSQHGHKDGSPNGIPHSLSSRTSLSRFSSEAINQTNEARSTPFTSDDSPKSDKADGDSKKDLESSKVTNNGHFHFSIYKWKTKSVPLDIPLRGKASRSSKDVAKSKPLSGINEDIASQSSDKTTPLVVESSSNGPSSTSDDHSNKLQNGFSRDEFTAEKEAPSAVKNEPDKAFVASKEEPKKPEVKSVHSLFYDDLEKGLDLSSNGSSSPAVGHTKTTKKQERKNTSLTGSEANKVKGVQFSPMRESNGRSKVKGRVKDFVKMFNQESSPKTRDGNVLRSKSCKWDEKCAFDEDEEKLNTPKEEEKFQMPKAKANEDPKQSAKVHPSGPDSSTPTSGSLSVGSKATAEETDESFHDDNFHVKELTQDENGQVGSVTQNQEFQGIDSKIRQWTKGKEGNIRSLLSTLQYVLWAESGWRPVPLVDIIEGSAVKRAYQKALLCLHPDKLQQKGAGSHQKYLAEKVFDILQEAWNYFNSLGAV